MEPTLTGLKIGKRNWKSSGRKKGGGTMIVLKSGHHVDAVTVIEDAGFVILRRM